MQVRIIISPCSVNLTALFARLTNIWVNLKGSPIKADGTLQPVSNNNSSDFSSTLLPITVDKLSNILFRLKFTCSSSIFPASIFEKSKISLIMPNNDSAE